MAERLVVIGAGMASGRMLEHLFEAAPGRWDVTLFNAEPRGNYNRIMLSPVLSGEKSYEEIVTHDAAWYESRGVDCRFGEPVTAIDRERKVVATARGETPYDKLVIATGSTPFVVPVPGHDLPGVVTYRDVDDTEALIDAARPGAQAVVIGGGLLGLEAAAGLRLRGMEVTVLHLMPHLMERQLDPAAGYLLQKELENRGIAIRCSANTHQIVGEDRVRAVRLDDGTEFAADIVCMAVGIRPAIALAKEAGLATGRGIHVDDDMVTSDADILALGECVEHRGACYGLVAPLYEMAKSAAATLAEAPAGYQGSEVSTKLKVTGIDLFSAGDFADGDDRDEIVFRDPARGVYKRLVLKDDRLIGAVLYGDTADGSWFFGHIRDRTDIADLRDTLIFGPAFAGGAPLDPMAAVAALPDEAEICGCNGICKGSDHGGHLLDGATTLDARARSPPRRLPVLRHLHRPGGAIAGSVTLGDELCRPGGVKPMCKCTDLTHEDVRRLIKSQRADRLCPPSGRNAGHWKTSCGCACRAGPALNFYLLADWPDWSIRTTRNRAS